MNRIGRGTDSAMLLARHAGREGGFVATRRNDESTADITDLIVHPSNSRHGIGTALVERAVASHGPPRLRRVLVRTEADSHRAIGFSERLGFRTSGRTTEDVSGDAVELCELVKSV